MILKERKPKDSYINSLLARIVEVFRGHFLWVFRKAEKQSGCFVSNYWVTGRIMTDDTRSWKPENCITDTAFQLLKAGECLKFYPEGDDRKSAMDAMGGLCQSWIGSLEERDKRDCSAWTHTEREDTNVFRLDDHFWIWKALKLIEDLKLWPEREGQRVMRHPEVIQQEILLRFTTENETLRKRMLAVRRSPRETRFLFHARDTALFYGSDWNFLLQETSFREVWENTIDAQALYGYNQGASWGNTLRYALAILMGTRNYSINQQSPAELVKWSMRSIFNSMSLNGFCPGQLNEITKAPVLFDREEDRDSYFHSSFEIPFVLLTNAAQINRIYDKETPNSPGVQASQLPKGQSVPLSVDVRDHLQGQKGTLKRQQGSHEEQIRDIESMKKTTPFNRLFDSATIVEMDEEWLYNYPPFLSNINITNDDIRKILFDLKKQKVDSDGNKRVIITAAKVRAEKGIQVFERYERRTLVEDTSKARGGRKLTGSGIGNWSRTNGELLGGLKLPRTTESAKKRLIWLFNANEETALVCYLTSVTIERPAISIFFDRHWNRDDYFFDDTTALTNTWETELHLSFYCLRNGRGTSGEDNVQILREDIFPGKEQQIIVTSMGFRFIGDFFDRYWTCHFIENGMALRPNYNWKTTLLSLPHPYLSNERVWNQRKVFELYLFEHILSTLVKCTREILDEIKRELGIRQGTLSSTILSSEDYFFSSVQWRQFQNTLEAMEEKLESVQLEVSKWETREKDRGKEKPRWTRNDERKYGATIKKLVRSTNKQIRELHSVYTSVKSLKETLVRSQEQIRADLSLRGSEDIRFFTYVTVVFLPLGFASSIFSMNGNPGSDLVTSLVICATIALLITVFALVNAKTLGYFVSRFFHLIEDYSRAKMKNSILMLENKERDKRRHDEEHDEEAEDYTQDEHVQAKDGTDKNPNETRKGRSRTKALQAQDTSRFWFLIAYILLELPARRVAIAYDVLKGPRFTGVGFVHVVLGVLFLMPCVLSGVLQIVVINTMDLLRLLFGKFM